MREQIKIAPGLAGMPARLRLAIDAAGGPSAISRMACVPLNTMAAYLKGGSAKVGTIVDIAGACGVRASWLITGEGGPHDAAPHDPHRARILKLGLRRPVGAAE